MARKGLQKEVGYFVYPPGALCPCRRLVWGLRLFNPEAVHFGLSSRCSSLPHASTYAPHAECCATNDQLGVKLNFVATDRGTLNLRDLRRAAEKRRKDEEPRAPHLVEEP